MLELPSDVRPAVWSKFEQGKVRVRTENSMARMAKQGTISLKMVSPVILRGAEEKAMLEKDLKQMGCHGLMLWPWCIKYEKIVQELQYKQANQWVGTIRRDLDLKMAAIWRKVYGISIRGEGMAM